MPENEFLASDSCVCLRGVCKSFTMGGDVLPVLQNVDLSVKRGEFVAVMGMSGSGKSTLLNVTGGLMSADSGFVSVDGVDLGGLNDKRLTEFRRDRIGFVFQMFNLVPSLTVEENILLPLLAGGKGEFFSKEACREMIAKVGLSSRIHHKPRELSGGEQQRVAIARALCRRPGLVLADEPTGNLDSDHTRMIGNLFRVLQRETGVTTMLVTHEPLVAMWADRVIVLRDGRIASDELTSKFSSSADLSVFYQEVMEHFKA